MSQISQETALRLFLKEALAVLVDHGLEGYCDSIYRDGWFERALEAARD